MSRGSLSLSAALGWPLSNKRSGIAPRRPTAAVTGREEQRRRDESGGGGWKGGALRDRESRESASALENYKRVPGVWCARARARTRAHARTHSIYGLYAVYFYSGHHGAGQLVNRHSRIDAHRCSLLSFAGSRRLPWTPCALLPSPLLALRR